MNKYDLVIIGAGPAGYEAAARAAVYGMKTALIEEKELGGTCLNRGCIPTKAMLHTTELMHECRQQKEEGIFDASPVCCFEKLVNRRNTVVDTLRSQVADLLKRSKVDVITGRGTITGPGRVEVHAADSVSALACENILIAAGSSSARIPVPGADLPGVIDSDGVFALTDVPEELVIVGGGVIGVEIASVFSTLGSKVTIIEMLPRILPNMDRELSQNLALILKKQGVEIHAKAGLKQIEKAENGKLACFYEEKGKACSASADKVLIATGRRANAAGIAADSLGLPIDRGIVTDAHGFTGVPGVWAAGDVTAGSPLLAHYASAAACAVIDRIAGKESGTDLTLVPACIYTSPEIACVGMTEEAAKEAGIKAKTKKAVMHGNARTVISGAGRSFMKVVFEEETGVILGAQLMCSRASDMIDEFTLAVERKLTMKELGSIIRPHPSFVEAAGELFREKP